MKCFTAMRVLLHANKSVTDGDSKLKEDVPFRKKVMEQVGTGFRLPVTKPA